jgi:hypothetical protein
VIPVELQDRSPERAEGERLAADLEPGFAAPLDLGGAGERKG